MSFSGRLSSADLQTFVFPRRELLKNWAAIASLLLLPRTQPQPAPVEPQPSVTKSSYPSPEFKIGDLIASDWEGEFGEDYIDFGEILGVCYLPEAQSIFPANTWVYYVNWTHSNCGADYYYPCYDGEPSCGSELRLAS